MLRERIVWILQRGLPLDGAGHALGDLHQCGTVGACQSRGVGGAPTIGACVGNRGGPARRGARVKKFAARVASAGWLVATTRAVCATSIAWGNSRRFSSTTAVRRRALAVAWAGTGVSVGAGERTVRSVGNGVGGDTDGAPGVQLSNTAVVSQSTHQAARTRGSVEGSRMPLLYRLISTALGALSKQAAPASRGGQRGVATERSQGAVPRLPHLHSGCPGCAHASKLGTSYSSHASPSSSGGVVFQRS
jgi:hypothetical protein